MSVSVSIEFSGEALQEPQNRDMVKHLVAVLRQEVKAYTESHGGYGEVNPPYITTEHVSVSVLGAVVVAAVGATPTTYTRYTAHASGSWHLPEGSKPQDD